jgi:hypothetical protein
MTFYNDAAHWNSIANLHLLNDSQNLSKGEKMLDDWLSDPSVHLSANDLLAGGVSLEFKDFKTFYSTRRANLKERLINRVFVTKSVTEETPVEDSDEEVVEETVA